MSVAVPRVEVERERVDGYLVLLFVLLSTATLFDGFDAAMLTVAAPDVRKSLGIELGEWGFYYAVTRIGVLASFVLLLWADRIGRRRMMTLSIIGFALASGASALALHKGEFVLWQSVARLFLTAEYALAVIIVSEEFPSRVRGLAIAILTSFATVGVMVMAKVQPLILLPVCASGSVAGGDCVAPAGNALHDFGMAMVGLAQQAVGREVDGASWRALYALGLLPLLVGLGLSFAIRETRRFEAEREIRAARRTAAGGWLAEVRAELTKALEPWRSAYRRRTALVTLLWNCNFLVTAPAVAYWVIFAREDLGFTPAIVGTIIFWGYLGGVVGNFVSGWLIERIGRRPTAVALYAFAAVAICMLFQVRSQEAQQLWMILTVFGFGAANTATHVFATELFPTAIRATGYGWTTNFFGRIAEFGTPLAIGALIAELGVSIPLAVAIVSIGPVLGAILVWRFAPETKGLTLEEVQKVAAS